MNTKQRRPRRCSKRKGTEEDNQVASSKALKKDHANNKTVNGSDDPQITEDIQDSPHIDVSGDQRQETAKYAPSFGKRKTTQKQPCSTTAVNDVPNTVELEEKMVTGLTESSSQENDQASGADCPETCEEMPANPGAANAEADLKVSTTGLDPVSTQPQNAMDVSLATADNGMDTSVITADSHQDNDQIYLNDREDPQLEPDDDPFERKAGQSSPLVVASPTGSSLTIVGGKSDTVEHPINTEPVEKVGNDAEQITHVNDATSSSSPATASENVTNSRSEDTVHLPSSPHELASQEAPETNTSLPNGAMTCNSSKAPPQHDKPSSDTNAIYFDTKSKQCNVLLPTDIALEAEIPENNSTVSGADYIPPVTLEGCAAELESFADDITDSQLCQVDEQIFPHSDLRIQPTVVSGSSNSYAASAPCDSSFQSTISRVNTVSKTRSEAASSQLQKAIGELEILNQVLMRCRKEVERMKTQWLASRQHRQQHLNSIQ